MNKKYVVFMLIVSIIVIAGCSSTQKKQDVLGEEYQRYVDAINNDATSLEKSLDKWNILMEQVNKGGTVDILDMESAQRDYTDIANVIKPKIQSLKSFIATNEAKLKEAGFDTFQEKQDLDEVLSGIENNVRNMKTEIDKLSTG
ncbi:MAG: hypothetical protein KJ583_01460 [Nanoarchaeota archaeon]|nr:hypothetical protein [Nanoarchaeota archaeon]MBU1603960.1 hypothetical protein [Nanoarchaeota archaeon]